MFQENLKKALTASGMNQKELASRSGIGPGSISHYLAGTSVPNDLNMERLESVLGPLKDSEDKESGNSENKDLNAVAAVAKAMGTTPDVIRAGAQQGVFPWAYAIKREKRWVYLINLSKFETVEGIKVS